MKGKGLMQTFIWDAAETGTEVRSGLQESVQRKLQGERREDEELPVMEDRLEADEEGETACAHDSAHSSSQTRGFKVAGSGAPRDGKARCGCPRCVWMCMWVCVCTCRRT